MLVVQGELAVAPLDTGGGALEQVGALLCHGLQLQAGACATAPAAARVRLPGTSAPAAPALPLLTRPR